MAIVISGRSALHRGDRIVGSVRSIVFFLDRHGFLPVRRLFPSLSLDGDTSCRCVAGVYKLKIVLCGSVRLEVHKLDIRPSVPILVQRGGKFQPLTAFNSSMQTEPDAPQSSDRTTTRH
ncbi:hypothetical protein MPL1032_180007 [Mesorhizobium plurifarium]|uniref:Uncharacterized protein n=1 Tax=Mesorhizobium plurifarium TaxID=69974 RepID=A0A0K2VTD8_MESPL|nr:hypothetical protein MPL1032_180007 [Mesorhizobium plurifarium]